LSHVDTVHMAQLRHVFCSNSENLAVKEKSRNILNSVKFSSMQSYEAQKTLALKRRKRWSFEI